MKKPGYDRCQGVHTEARFKKCVKRGHNLTHWNRKKLSKKKYINITQFNKNRKKGIKK